MKTHLLIFFAFFSFSALAQITYDEGYYVSNEGDRIEGFIQDKGWRSNPSEFSFKPSRNSDSRTVDIKEATEFGIGEEIKYRRFIAPIDKSSERVDQLDVNREPNFEKEQVFLKVLMEGEVDLYKYTSQRMERFFYGMEGVKVEPLVHKKYQEAGKLAFNNSFRQQLYAQFSCGDLTADDLRKVQYREKDLMNFFKDYHDCRNASYHVVKRSSENMSLNVYVKAGAGSSSMTINKGIGAGGTELDLGTNIRFGAELEWVLPFNRNKWALFLEPTYFSYNIEEYLVTGPFYYNRATLLLDHSFIATTGGAKHFFYLNERSKIFVNAAVVIDVPLNSGLVFIREGSYELQPTLEETTTEAYFSAGVGYNYSNRLTAELRYEFPKRNLGSRTVSGHYMLDWDAEISTISVMLGYRIF